MITLDLEKINDKYFVRRMTNKDVPTIYSLCKGNKFFYQCCGEETTPSRIESDLTLLPSDTLPSQKYYLGFFDCEKLVAVIDLIIGYPDEKTAFIGFFMTDVSLQGKGEGTEIINQLSLYLHSIGIASIRLGVEKDNPQATHFWHKNGFITLREIKQNGSALLYQEKIL